MRVAALAVVALACVVGAADVLHPWKVCRRPLNLRSVWVEMTRATQGLSDRRAGRLLATQWRHPPEVRVRPHALRHL